jgi:ATP-binding cassette subfamily C (CFTR/MRP) protein 1
LWRALFVAYGGPFAIAAGLKVVQDLLAFLQPQLLRWLLSYISRYQDARFQSNERPSELQGFAIAIIMFMASVTQTICLNQVSVFLIHILKLLGSLGVCLFLKYFQRAFETG